MTKWKELIDRFHKLAETTGCSKSSSYMVQIQFHCNNRIYIELGGYDVGLWPRHTNVGPFDTEEEALIAFEKKVEEAEQVVALEESDEYP